MEPMGVVTRSRMWVQSVGMAIGCGVWRYIDFLILLILTLLSAHFGSTIPTFLPLKKMFL